MIASNSTISKCNGSPSCAAVAHSQSVISVAAADDAVGDDTCLNGYVNNCVTVQLSAVATVLLPVLLTGAVVK
jgi:hypothetical protein